METQRCSSNLRQRMIQAHRSTSLEVEDDAGATQRLRMISAQRCTHPPVNEQQLWCNNVSKQSQSLYWHPRTYFKVSTVVQGRNDPIDGIIDIGEIPLQHPVAEHVDSLAVEHLFAEVVHRHVWPTPRPIHLRRITHASVSQSIV